MRIGVIVNSGFEKAAVVQINELISSIKKSDIDDINDTLVSFECNNWENICKFIYLNQISNRVIYLIDTFNYTTDELAIIQVKECILKKEDSFFKELLLKSVDFRVSVKIDEHTDVTYLESEIGGVILDYAQSLDKTLKVNLKNPLINFYIYINEGKAYVGIDLSSDLSKRDYKIFNNAVSLKGPTAFGLLMLAGYKPKEVYLNPCCYSGTIEIEAALYATQTSHRLYNKDFPIIKLLNLINTTEGTYWDNFFKQIDKNKIQEKQFSITGSDKLLSSISAATKNAKIAGVESHINFRRIDFDWMDIKYDENSFDKIITFIPGSSKHDKNIIKDLDQIFYQAEYILKKSGKLIIMCLSKDLLIESSTKYFDLDNELIVHSGGQMMYVLFFKRKPKSKDEDKKDNKE
jgi:23S rRNA G2445 N2-methylase RlmL